MNFAGYAALFGVPDAAQDIIVPGAFVHSLASRRGAVPLFWQHKPDQPLGLITSIAEDARGLRVIGQIDNPHGRPAALLSQRTLCGLSFGYRARQFTRRPQGRVLLDIDLFEISLVMHPLQHGARVHMVC
ncbi:HK97 family phage prohead protease [Pontixanthobacter sp.]|uniref:HK97 family phage prohead protease n=1 Tax=Pontixanthobacter sp. TaxID=2792078 RepID=UPI003C7BBCC3